MTYPPLDHLVDNVPIDFTRLMYMLYLDMEQQTSRADLKSQIILSANAIFLAIAANFGLGLESDMLQHITTLEVVVITANLLMLVAMIISVYFSLSAAFPRKGMDIHVGQDDCDLFYFGHICQLTETQYMDRFLSMSMQDVKQETILAIHAKAGIVAAKYKNVRYSMIFIFIAILLWSVSRALLNLM